MRKFFFLLSIFYISLGISRTLCLAKEKVYFCHRLVKKPLLDGKVRNDPGWENVSEATGFVKLGTTSLSSKQTSFKIGYSGEGIYIGIECEEPEIEKVKARQKDMEGLWNEDSIEIFIFPEGTDNYYQFVVNTIGSRWGGAGKSRPLAPLSLDWDAYTCKGKDYWSAEIRIPFEIFEKIPEKDEIWTGNICRNIYTSGDKHSSWAPLKKGFHEPGNWGKIVFKDALLPEEVARIEKNLIKKYLRKKTKKVENLISNWEKEDPLFFKKIKKNLQSYLVEWEKAKKEFSNLDSLPPQEIHKLLEIVRKFADLQPYIDKLRAEFIHENLFSEEE